MTAPDLPVLETFDDGVLTLTLNRPRVRNALNLAMLDRLESLLIDLTNRRDVRVVLLRGAGEAFMAGGDIKYFEGLIGRSEAPPSHGFSRMLSRINLIVQLLRSLPQPVVAAVEGPCAGFGVSLALACDLVIAADTAKFTLAYDRLGLTPDGGASWHLVYTLGLKRAAVLTLLGETIDAATAENWGMVSRVVPSAELDKTVGQIAARLKAGAPQAQARAKQLLNHAGEMQLAAQLDAEAEHFLHLTNSDDFAEGVAAFLGKRNPGFKGS